MRNEFTTIDAGGAGAEISVRKSHIPITILRRPDGERWRPIEVTIMRTHLQTNVVGDPHHPEYLVARGHFPPEKTFPTAGFHETPHVVLLSQGPASRDLPFVARIV